MTIKDIVLAAVREAWQEHLLHQLSVDIANEDAAALIAAWKAQTLSQVTSIYGSYYHSGDKDGIVSQQEIETCIDTTIQAWKEAPPKSSTDVAPSATKQTSFSLFASLGDGGLAAFFSWPTLAESDNEEEIWQALLRVEYLEDAWADWTTGIRPWIQARLLQTLHGGRLCRTWYGKARKQASPETNAMILDFMQDVFTAVDSPTNTTTLPSHDTLTASRQALLSVGLDMVLDHVTRQGIVSLPPSICLVALWNASFDETLMDTLATRDPRARWLHLYLQAHPTLYRQVGNDLDLTLLGDYLQQQQTQPDALQQKRYLYVMAIMSNLLILVRVAGLPWDAIATGNQAKDLVYQRLWTVVRDAETPHRELYVRGVEALLAGSNGQDGLRETFQKDWVLIKDHHAVPELQPLHCFATE